MEGQGSIFTRSPTVLLGLLRFGDIAMVVVCGVAAYFWRHGFTELPERYWLALAIAALLTAQIFHFSRLYMFSVLDRLFRQLGLLLPAWGAVGMLLIAMMFFTKTGEDFSRVWAATWFAASLAGFALVRIWLKISLMRWRAQGQLNRNVAIVGAGAHGRRLIEHLLAQSESGGFNLIGLFDDRTTRIPAHDIEGVPILGSVDDLIEQSRRKRIDQVIIALPWTAENRLVQIINKLRQCPVDLQLCPEDIGFRLFERRIDYTAGVPMITVFERPLTGWNYVLKEIEDRVLAALILLLVSPLMLLIALAIKLESSGPVLFRQQRYGFNNNLITVLKFRSMYHGRAPDAEQGTPQAQRHDPRITAVGRFLRRTSLDELPQFLNVLEGSMSIVGPRPHAVAHNQQYGEVINQYFGRHRVKPGITGWAQIHGYRGETETLEKMEKRVEYDLYYIENWSLLLDLKIIFLTLFVGFVHENAY